MTLSGVLLTAYAATPSLCWLLNAVSLRRRIHWFVLFVLACIIGYAVLLIAVYVADMELERELYRHDLDGDGSFSESEMTPEAQQAMDAWASDTGRRFAPFTGIPITFIWTTINFFFLGAFNWIGRSFWRMVFGHARPAVASSQEPYPLPNSATAETGNPYQPPTDIGESS